MANSGSGHHDQDQVLNHVVPEQLAVVDADEAEDGHPGGEERPDPGHRLADRPGVARVQRVVASYAPEVQHQRYEDHRHRHEVELRRKSWWPASGGRESSSRTAITRANVLLQNVVVQLRCVVVELDS